MKRLFGLFALAALFISTPLLAATTESTFTGAQTLSILEGSVKVNKLEIQNATAGTATFTLYDAPAAITGGLTYNVGAYTNFNISIQNVTNTWTNILGVVNSEVVQKRVKTETVTAASTPTYNKITQTISIPANSTSTITFPVTTLTTFGVGGVSSTNLAVTVYTTAN